MRRSRTVPTGENDSAASSQNLQGQLTAAAGLLAKILSLPLPSEVNASLQRLSNGILYLQTLLLLPANTTTRDAVIFPSYPPSSNVPSSLRPMTPTRCATWPIPSVDSQVAPWDSEEAAKVLAQFAGSLIATLTTLNAELELLLQTHSPGVLRGWYNTALWREKEALVWGLVERVRRSEDIVCMANKALGGECGDGDASQNVIRMVREMVNDSFGPSETRQHSETRRNDGSQVDLLQIYQEAEPESPRSRTLRERITGVINGRGSVSAPTSTTSSRAGSSYSDGHFREGLSQMSSESIYADSKPPTTSASLPITGDIRDIHPALRPSASSTDARMEYPFYAGPAELHQNLAGMWLHPNENFSRAMTLGEVSAAEPALQEDEWDQFARAEYRGGGDNSDSRRHTIQFGATAGKVGWFWSKTTKLRKGQKHKGKSGAPATFPAAGVWIPTAEVRIIREEWDHGRLKQVVLKGAIPVDMGAALKRWLDEEMRHPAINGRPNFTLPAFIAKRTHPLLSSSCSAPWPTMLCSQDPLAMNHLFWTLPRDDQCLLLYLLGAFRFLVQQYSHSVHRIATLFLPHLVSLATGEQMRFGDASAMITGLTILIMAHPGFLSRPLRPGPTADKTGRKLREELRRWQQEAKTELTPSSSEVVRLQMVHHVLGMPVGSRGESERRDGQREIRRET